MKQFITICTIALLSFAGTQNTQAQTKEETIKWVETNFLKYEGYTDRGYKFSDLEVSPCKIKFYY